LIHFYKRNKPNLTTEAASEMNCDIMKRLFEMDLDEILQKIFLNLDPLSLKNCKCVNKDWYYFIQTRLWECKPARDYLHDKLINQWKYGDPAVAVHDQGVVNYLVCDDEMVVCGYTTGQARAYNVYTGELIFQLQCNNSTPEEEYINIDEVQLDIGRNVISSVTESGWVSVFCKTDGRKLYQERHHGEYQTVDGVKVTDSYVLTAGGDGSLVKVESVKGVWRVTQETFENKEHITHIEADGKWAVTGSTKSVKLWDMDQYKLVQVGTGKVEAMVFMLSFSFPHVFVVGGGDWPGIQVWDIMRSHLIRHVDSEGNHFHKIHLHGRFLTVSEVNKFDEDNNSEVLIYDVTELLELKFEATKLWKKSFKFPLGPHGPINAVSNKTSLIVSHGSAVSTYYFWKDRIVPSGQYAPTHACSFIQDFSYYDEEDWEEE